ncbi:MAG: hypothetical protein A2086_07185 [Spirochaetes bacterium GWD1_27_9]|nr:MAG: hypothetical protein A2Z98_11630 [Spirochaetes bacterium GWB1_27_13]OHD25693.1 MAG: hypothetical protein A2Y34_14340 [Spirochaetes bacterium GWC1_27_15]OHD32186.1 MAG: hypothetical protein A2086_07185 [Spirochaetes bacterium GWD1_27_9]
MKKIIVLLLVLSLLSCAINENTGLISIRNSSSSSINISIGSYKAYVSAGGTYDYWFYNPFSCSVSADGNSHVYIASYYNDVLGDVFYNETISASFKTNYKYEIDVIGLNLTDYYSTNKFYQLVYINQGVKNGGNGLREKDNIHYPGE